MNTTEKIAELEKELADLREQERAEKEEAKAKAEKEFESDFKKLEEQIREFNIKHNEALYLSRRRSVHDFGSLFFNL